MRKPQGEAELDRLNLEIDVLSRKKGHWSDEDKARASAFISLNYHRKVCVTRGLSRGVPPGSNKKRKMAESNATQEEDGQIRSNDTLSDRPLKDLTSGSCPDQVENSPEHKSF